MPLATIVREWGRIGCIGFGGPPAHIRLLRDLCVERRHWVDAQDFEDAIAVLRPSDLLTHIRGQPNVSPLAPVFLAVGEEDQAPLVPITTIEVLLDNNQVYLVDRPAGAVHRIDPRTAADVGPPWLAGTALADAVLDGSGTVWALGTDARLHTLNWSPQTQTLHDVSPVRHHAR